MFSFFVIYKNINNLLNLKPALWHFCCKIFQSKKYSAPLKKAAKSLQLPHLILFPIELP